MNSALTTAAAGGSSSALAIVMVWLLGLWHITMPTEVALSATVIAMPFIHWGMAKFGIQGAGP